MKAKPIIVRTLTATVPREMLRRLYHHWSKWTAILKYGDATFPRIFTIEINTHCNRACLYCPNFIAPQQFKMMEPEVFRAIVDRLREIRYGGVVDFIFFSEPTMHPRLAECIQLVTDRVPWAMTRISTNGDLLTHERVKDFRRAGLSRIYVMRHNPTPIGWRERIADLASSNPGLFVCMDIDEQEQEFGLHDYGGKVSVKNVRPPTLRQGKPFCGVHTHIAQIDVTGDWLLCCVDYERTLSFGNLVHENIMEIWKKPGFVQMRIDLNNGIARLPVCKTCPCLVLKQP